jgi:hypothetical protein
MDVKAATLKRSPSTAMFPDVTVNCAVPLVPMTLLRLVSIRSSASVLVLAGREIGEIPIRPPFASQAVMVPLAATELGLTIATLVTNEPVSSKVSVFEVAFAGEERHYRFLARLPEHAVALYSARKSKLRVSLVYDDAPPSGASMMAVPCAARFTFVVDPVGTFKGVPASLTKLTGNDTEVPETFVKYSAEYQPPSNANCERMLDPRFEG